MTARTCPLARKAQDLSPTPSPFFLFPTLSKDLAPFDLFPQTEGSNLSFFPQGGSYTRA